MSGVICYLKNADILRLRSVWGFSMLVFLAGCGYEEVRNINKTMTVQSNAYYVAIKDGTTADWEVLVPGNVESQLLARSFVVEDSAGMFSVMLVCNTKNENSPSKVYLLNSSLSDMNSVNHVCRKPQSERIPTVMYGEVQGVDTRQGEMAVLSFARDVAPECALPGGCDSDTARLRNVEGFAVKTFDGVRDILGYKGIYNETTDNVAQKVFYISREVDFSTSVERRDILFQDKVPSTGSNFMDNGNISHVPSNSPATIQWATQAGFTGDLKGSVRFVSKGNNVLPLAETALVSSTSLDFLPLPERAYKNASSDPLIVQPVDAGTAFIQADEGHEFSLEITDSGVTGVTRKLVSFFPSMQPDETRTMQFPAAAAGNELQVLARNKTDYALPEVSWSSFSDSNYGAAQVFYTILSGSSTRTQGVNDFPKLSSALEWHVITTRQSGYASSGVLIPLPTMTGAASWSKNWLFKKALPVSVTGHAYASKKSAEGIVAYIMDKSYSPDLIFSRVTLYHPDVPPLD